MPNTRGIWGGSSYETIELILFILGSWLGTVVDSFIILTSASELYGSWWWSFFVVEPLMMIWEVPICRPSRISTCTSGVFRGITEVCHWWHIWLTNLTNTSQATEYFALDDCKGASPGRNKVSLSTKSLIIIKDIIGPHFHSPKRGLASASYMAKLGCHSS
jgi:hypothetical protein